MTNAGWKCLIILQKHLQIRIYHFVLTPLEILLPILMTFLLLYLKLTAETANPSSSTRIFPSLVYPEEVQFFAGFLRYFKVLFVPDNGYTRSLPSYWYDMTYHFYNETGIFHYLDQDSFEKRNYSVIPDIVVEFQNKFPDNALLPHDLQYCIYGNTKNGIWTETVTSLQHAIALHFISAVKGRNITSEVTFALQKFPEPARDAGDQYQRVIFTFYLYVIPLFFAFLVPVLVTQIVMEKQSGIKELMRLMGMPVSIQWFGFFINTFIVTIASVVVISYLLTNFGFSQSVTVEDEDVNSFNRTYRDIYYTSPPLLGKTAWYHVFMVFILYILSSISFCLFLSTVFGTATKATLCGLLLWVVSYMGPLIGTSAGAVGALTLHEMMLWALFPNMALFWSLRFIGFQELQDGLKWRDYITPPTIAEDACLLPLLAMFVVDIFLYWFIGWYLDKLFPGKYGVPRPWYFLCTDASKCSKCNQDHDDEESLSSTSTDEPSCFHWCFVSRLDAVLRILHINILSEPPHTSEKSTDSEFFESEPSGLRKSITAHKLTKIFRPGLLTPPFLAVDNISLNAYGGEIFVLLGKNGAGKTVTLSMLTGIYAPTRGTVFIKGYDIRKQISKAREVIGYCPQENMMFSELTVMQHLIFFGKLKGLKCKALDSKISNLLRMLKLWEKRHKRPTKLSGGMQRRLQFAISVIGNVQLLVLDEPTSGLDPESRRILWDMLLQIRHTCCILLTTHHMEEADALADRIAIMARGNIVCCGSPMFLRHMFGSDYIMKISKAVGCDATEVLRFVKRFVATATVDNETRTEISLKLPVEYKGAFPSLFRELEKQLERLNISTFGLGTLGLDEIFLKVNEMVENTNKSSKKDEVSDTVLEDLQIAEGCQLCCHRLLGLLMKRIYYVSHRPVLFIFMLLLIILLLIAVISIFKEDLNSIILTDRLFENPFTLRRLVVFEFHNTSKYCLPEAYITNIPDHVTLKKVTEDLLMSILEIAKRDKLGYNYGHYAMAASFTSSQNGSVLAKALYRGKPGYGEMYTKISSLNLVHNAVLQNCEEHRQIMVKLRITSFDPPLETTYNQADNMQRDNMLIKLLFYFCAAVLLVLGMCLITCSFVLLVVQERIKQFKHLQIMTGIGSVYFWAAAFLFDFIFYLMHVVCIIATLQIFAEGGPYVSLIVTAFSFLTMLLFGWTAIPFAYFISLCPKSPAGAYVLLLSVHLLSIILCIIRLVIEGNERFANQLIAALFDCFPGCAAISVFYHLWKENLNATSGGGHVNASTVLGIVKYTLLVMFVSGVIYMLLILLRDFRYYAWTYSLFGKGETSAIDEEPDVEAETKRIKRQLQRREQVLQSDDSSRQGAWPPDSDALIVHNLSKKFNKQNIVDHLTFGVREDDCFGLLGVNGAGKTTTFHMLTGALLMNSGNVYLLDTSLRKNPSKYLSKVGYCPQFHTHIDQLTCREILLVFARLRGIKGDLKKIVNAYINQFGLSEHFWKRTADCSLGTSRKLSTALAFVGTPDLVMLDEPTTGVDPGSRRIIWNVIAASKTKGTSVILTSHSMDECEILCTRLAIMKKGKFKCIGSGQYLKSKFGKGFNVSVKLAKEFDAEKLAKNRDAVINFMDRQFTDCKIIDDHEGLLEYSVPFSAADWHKLFTLMEEAKTKFKLEDYNVSQATLEQVFLAFASESEE